MSFNWKGFAVKALQLAMIADQEFEATQAPGGNASTLLQPNNFNNLIAELASVAAPAQPAAAPTQTPGTSA